MSLFNPLHSESKFSGQTIRYVHSCLDLVILLTPSQCVPWVSGSWIFWKTKPVLPNWQPRLVWGFKNHWLPTRAICISFIQDGKLWTIDMPNRLIDLATKVALRAQGLKWVETSLVWSQLFFNSLSNQSLAENTRTSNTGLKIFPDEW